MVFHHATFLKQKHEKHVTGLSNDPISLLNQYPNLTDVLSSASQNSAVHLKGMNSRPSNTGGITEFGSYSLSQGSTHLCS